MARSSVTCHLKENAMVEPYRPLPPIQLPDTSAEKNLHLLTIFHYVVGVLVVLFSSLFIIHIVMGVLMLTHGGSWLMPPAQGSLPPPPLFGAFFVAMGSVAVLFGWTMGALTIVAGRSIERRRRHLFCMIVAGLLCMWAPFGTVLGVFTLVILTKPHVRQQFWAQAAQS
jgi:hypothetical protein